MSTFNTHSACPTPGPDAPTPGTYIAQPLTREDTAAAMQAAYAASGTSGHTAALAHAAAVVRQRKAQLRQCSGPVFPATDAFAATGPATLTPHTW